jgi:hypothetical protein
LQKRERVIHSGVNLAVENENDLNLTSQITVYQNIQFHEVKHFEK